MRVREFVQNVAFVSGVSVIISGGAQAFDVKLEANLGLTRYSVSDDRSVFTDSMLKPIFMGMDIIVASSVRPLSEIPIDFGISFDIAHYANSRKQTLTGATGDIEVLAHVPEYLSLSPYVRLGRTILGHYITTRTEPEFSAAFEPRGLHLGVGVEKNISEALGLLFEYRTSIAGEINTVNYESEEYPYGAGISQRSDAFSDSVIIGLRKKIPL